MQSPPPKVYHDLLDAAARVGALEERIGYVFKNRMTCIEALKMNDFPLYYSGTIHECGKNNRLALLGDRMYVSPGDSVFDTRTDLVQR
jgi:hypothetical protein